MHTLIYTCSIHMYLPSAHTPHTNMHIHAHTNALRCTLMRAHRRTRTHMHTCMGTHVHTHWDVSFPPPWRLRGLQGNRSHVPTGEKGALPTGAPDSPLNPSPPGGPGARLLPGAQEGCPPAAFSLEKPAPTGGFHPPPRAPATTCTAGPCALGEAHLCPRPHSKGSQGRAAHPYWMHGRRVEPTTSALVVVLASTLPAELWRGPGA